MDGKLIVLCGERPTINEYGNRIDEQSNILIKREQRYYNIKQEVVEVDEHKKVINAIDLLNDRITESTESDIIFVDWETIIPNNKESMIDMIKFSMSTQEIPLHILLEATKKQSLLKKVYIDRLLHIDKTKERPCIDYQSQAMEEFFGLLLQALEKNQVVSILPTFSNSDSSDINKPRLKVIQILKNKNEMTVKNNGKRKVDILEPIHYDEFEEIYNRAMQEMLKILDKPDWYDKPEEQEEDEPGGRV